MYQDNSADPFFLPVGTDNDDPMVGSSATAAALTTPTSSVLPYSIFSPTTFLGLDVGEVDLAAGVDLQTATTGLSAEDLTASGLGEADSLVGTQVLPLDFMANPENPFEMEALETARRKKEELSKDAFQKNDFMFLSKILELLEVIQSEQDRQSYVHTLMTNIQGQFQRCHAVLENLPGADLSRKQQDELIEEKQRTLARKIAERKSYQAHPLMNKLKPTRPPSQPKNADTLNLEGEHLPSSFPDTDPIVNQSMHVDLGLHTNLGDSLQLDPSIHIDPNSMHDPSAIDVNYEDLITSALESGAANDIMKEIIDSNDIETANGMLLVDTSVTTMDINEGTLPEVDMDSNQG